LPETAAGKDPLALYVHWPFCVSKCPYCDFNSHVRESVDADLWAEALLSDLAHEAALLPGRRLESIFFGGGTPSLMPPRIAAAVIEAATRAWSADAGIEITLEANPSSVEASRFADFAAAGVNRVSLGLQALDDAALRFLGRAHDEREGLAALDTAQRSFDRVSFDLIYARPGQTLEGWSAELDRALAFGTEHLSLYQLTIEQGTRFATLARLGELELPDGDTAAELFDLTAARTAAAGLPGYEISNHARPGAESRHNLIYWRYGDYAGIGPGAHGRRTGLATERVRLPERYLEAVSASGHGISVERPLEDDERAHEALMMGLRLSEGIDPAHFHRRTGRALDDVIDPRALARLAAGGFVARDLAGLRILPPGRLLTDRILGELVL